MIYISINCAGQLADEFIACDRDYFSREGYEALFELLDDGDATELDVTDICCEYREDNWEVIARDMDIVGIDAEYDEESNIDIVRGYLDDSCTWYRETSKGRFIYQVE